jgi:hypothetical protein
MNTTEKYTFEREQRIVEKLLPSDYTVELRSNGLHCHSTKGIDENTAEWNEFVEKVKKEFPTQFMEIFHQTCTNHVKFTLYLYEPCFINIEGKQYQIHKEVLNLIKATSEERDRLRFDMN